MKVCGRSEWLWDDETNKVSRITIYLDSRRDGRVSLVIHELLHIYMELNFKLTDRMVYELEEAAILAWERKLYDRLHDPKRHDELESWSRAIERKMR